MQAVDQALVKFGMAMGRLDNLLLGWTSVGACARSSVICKSPAYARPGSAEDGLCEIGRYG